MYFNMRNRFLEIILILFNLFYAGFVTYRVNHTFWRVETFPQAVIVQKLLFIILILLIVSNFIYERKLLKHKTYKLAITLLCLDFLIILPVLYFTINELL